MKKRNTTYSHKRLDERYSLYGMFSHPDVAKSDIVGIDVIPTNVNVCRVAYDGEHVWSKRNFYSGDIIEICPTRPISKESLYSREVRDMAFEIVPNTMYVIPMGYCQHYDIISKFHPEANCDYEWNEKNNTLVIRALKEIPKDSLLILNIEK